MELRHLRGFVAVAEELHFGRAAARLHMAQPPLSQQIRLLERDLGVQLFDRSTRSVKLTSAGEVLLGPAREVLAAAGVVQRAAYASGRGEIGRVRVGFAGASSYDALPRLARAVTSQLPGIELVLKGQTYSGEALRQLAAGELEIGFISARDTIPGVSMRTVHLENLVAALPDSHALAGQDAIDLAALANEWFVAFPAAAGSAIREESERLCHRAGFAPRVAQEAPDAYNLLTLVGAGVGVALVVESSQHIRLDTVVYRPLVGERAPLRIALAWNATGASPAVSAVLRVAESVLPTPPTKTT